MRKLKLIVTGAVAAAMLALPGAALAKSRDRDHDKMPDRWERAHHLSTHKKNAKGDPDRDGLSNLGEFRSHTNPHDADTDNDGVRDGDEDRDRDGVDDQNEMEEHTNPSDRDTDNDGVNDGREDRDNDDLDNAGEDETANDPNDPDTDDDGVEDGEEQSGTVASFDPATNVLTINLAGGGTASGVVTDSTELKCETEDEQEDANDDRGDDSRVVASRDGSDDGDRSGSDDGDRSGSSDGDNSGPGSTSSGPGDGDRQEGDDDAEDNSCTTADLTPGTPVHEAELNTAADPDAWTEVELLK